MTTAIVISYCPTCGQPHKYLATCKDCGAAAVRGTMEEMYTVQGAHKAAAPVAPPVAESFDVAAYRAHVREEARRELAAMSSRRSSAPWQRRRCSCGHCMSCIGE